MRIAAISINGPRQICINFQFPIIRRLQENFEENWPRGFRGEVVQMCGRSTDDGRTDNGRTVITIAQPEPSAKAS